MPKTYTFTFPGTKDAFLQQLKQYSDYETWNEDKIFYPDDYLVKIQDGVLHFGVAPGGHSGGYWFVPKITDNGDTLVFSGDIRYIDPKSDAKGINAIGEFFAILLFLPIILIMKIYVLFDDLKRKVKHLPKEKSLEDRLFDLMERYLGCTQTENR